MRNSKDSHTLSNKCKQNVTTEVNVSCWISKKIYETLFLIMPHTNQYNTTVRSRHKK